MRGDAEACWVAITFPVVVAGKEALPIPVSSEDDDSSDGNHDLCDDDDAETISSVEYFIPHICRAKAASPTYPELQWVQEAEEKILWHAV